MFAKIKRWTKFTWLYTTSMFLPTAIITPRIERALKEFEEDERREALRKSGAIG